MKVVLVEPGKIAKTVKINNERSELQSICGGHLEVVFSFDDMACIICNDFGKILGLPFNRGLREKSTGELLDFIAGTFIICDCSTGEFDSLSQEQIERYIERFEYPEYLFKIGDTYTSIPYTIID